MGICTSDVGELFVYVHASFKDFGEPGPCGFNDAWKTVGSVITAGPDPQSVFCSRSLADLVHL